MPIQAKQPRTISRANGAKLDKAHRASKMRAQSPHTPHQPDDFFIFSVQQGHLLAPWLEMPMHTTTIAELGQNSSPDSSLLDMSSTLRAGRLPAQDAGREPVKLQPRSHMICAQVQAEQPVTQTFTT